MFFSFTILHNLFLPTRIQNTTTAQTLAMNRATRVSLKREASLPTLNLRSQSLTPAATATFPSAATAA